MRGRKKREMDSVDRWNEQNENVVLGGRKSGRDVYDSTIGVREIPE